MEESDAIIGEVCQSSMLSVVIQNMGLLCSRNRGYNEAETEANAQVVYTSDTLYVVFHE